MIIIGSDHAGYSLKEEIKKYLEIINMKYEDIGTKNAESVDYPDIAASLSKKVLEDPKNVGILICGTGIGVSMTANRFKGIRAALCTYPYMAKMARNHNDANVLCLGGRLISPSLANETVNVFLNEKFEGGRHKRRTDKMDTCNS